MNNRVPILQMRGPALNISHAVAAYRLTEDLTHGTANVRVYENSFKPRSALENRAQSAMIVLDGRGTFDYKEYYDKVDVTHNPGAGFGKDLFEWMKDTARDLFSFWFDLDKILVFHKCPVYALITDNMGQRIGFVDSLTTSSLFPPPPPLPVPRVAFPRQAPAGPPRTDGLD